MIDYMLTDNQCRSRQLLRYFGEENAHDCGQCDVCLSNNSTSASEQAKDEAQQRILDMLADHKKHHVTQLRTIPLPYEQIETALEYLMLEEQLYLEDGYLTLA